MSDPRIPSEAKQAEFRTFVAKHKKDWPNTPSWTAELLDWVDALVEQAREEKAKGGLTAEEIDQACKNIGHDMTCGSCACQFYTGYSAYEHTCLEHSNGQ
jgi:hypothetical protein